MILLTLGWATSLPDSLLAQKAHETLGPSSRRTSFALSEIMYNPGPSDGSANGEFVEIYNSQPWPVSIGDHRLTGGIQYRFPSETHVPANGFIVVAKSPSHLAEAQGLESVLGPFEGRLADSGDRIRLENPSGAVLLELEYQDRLPWPESADGKGYSLVLSHPSYHESDPRAWSASPQIGGTPGKPNDFIRSSLTESRRNSQTRELVINELMFNPISGESEHEYVEFYNRSSMELDLSGWQLKGGIRFEFPAGTRLPAGEYLTLAKDVGLLRSRHPHLDSSNSLGDFQGQLSNRGEMLRLLRPLREDEDRDTFETEPTPLVLVDELRYWDRSRNSRWADGGGSSLELINPDSDNDEPANWADSDESEKSEWSTFTVSGELGGTRRGAARFLQIAHLGSGDCLIDDLTLSVPGEDNQIPDPEFSMGQGRWRFQGNHERSEITTNEGTDGALLVRASGRGDPHSNRIQLDTREMRFPIPGEVSLTAKVRWLRGFPEILFRFQQNYFEAFHRMAIPANLGTPSLKNSRWAPNTGPTITKVNHAPVLPAEGEPVVMSAAVSDFDGVNQVTLHLRIDGSDEVPARVPMQDDGIAPDEIADDGIYSARIDGHPERTVVAFRIVASDGSASSTERAFPADNPDSEALIRFGDPPSTGAFGHYRIWYTRETLGRWIDSNRTPASNEPLPVTFVYNGERAYHDIAATYSGSFFNSPNYTSPTGSPCDYVLRFPSNERLLGASRVLLSWPGLTGIPDPTLQREQLSYWVGSQLGLPFNHRRYVSVFVDGRRRGIVMEDTQRPNGDMVRQWFPNDDDGELVKIQVRYESSITARQPAASQPASLELRLNSDGTKRLASYRWNWAPQSDGPTANDFSSIFQLVDTANIPDREAYLTAVRQEIDIEQWMRTFALENLVGNWDSFGFSNGQNMYTYKPQNQGWQLMIWDLDIGMGSGIGENPRAPLFRIGSAFIPATEGDHATIGRMYDTPEFQRAYYRALLDATTGPFNEEAVRNILLPKFDALSQVVDRPRVASPNSIISYVSSRHDFVTSRLEALPDEFSIEASDSEIFTDTPAITLTGKAPISVHHLRVNGIPQTADWTDVTDWQINYTLRRPKQTLRIQGMDRHGNPIQSYQLQPTLIYTGDSAQLPPQILINEWMAANESFLADPIDNDFEDWIELYNPNTEAQDLTGFSLTDNPTSPNKWTFPEGSILEGQSFLLIWADAEPDQTEPPSTYHANFRLSAEGETISLIDPNGELIDQVSFGKQNTNTSYGRQSGDESQSLSIALKTPTPGTPNPTEQAPQIEEWHRVSPDKLSLKWTATPGTSYQLQVTPSLKNPQWENVGPSIEPTTSEATAEVSLDDSTPQAFFRITITGS